MGPEMITNKMAERERLISRGRREFHNRGMVLFLEKECLNLKEDDDQVEYTSGKIISLK